LAWARPRLVSRRFRALIVAGFVQGLGEALILPNGLSVLGQAFPADKKARGGRIWSAAALSASGVRLRSPARSSITGPGGRTFLMLLPVVAGALAVGTVWIANDSPTSHARSTSAAPSFRQSARRAGAGLTSLTNGSGLKLLGVVTLIVGLGG